MKYQAEGHKAEFLGTVQTMGGFSIKADGKAFVALTSNLYTNQIGAMIRELSTNAQDAQRDKDRKLGTKTQCAIPFDIHLPTELEPYFFVRDYGTGLTFEQMQKVYTVIFESTKDNSDDDTGCFGLGSKTPLSYNTRSFIVTSYQNGKERSYSAYFREDGIPDIAFQDERDTNEPDGLKVYVTARKEDIGSFIANAKIYLPHFKNPSANVLNPSFEFANEEEFLTGTNWRILSESVQSSNYCLMGPVPYPISLWNVNVDSSKEQTFNEVRGILDNLKRKGFTVEFTVPMGDLTPQLSREELYYDEKTCENLCNIVIAFKKELIEKIQNRMAEVTEHDSYFQSCMEYTNLSERKFSFLANQAISNPQWNGDIPVDKKDAFNGWLVRTILDLSQIDVEYVHYQNKYSRGKYVTRHETDSTIDIKWLWHDEVFFVTPNNCTGYKSRVRYFASQNRDRNVFVFEDDVFAKMRDLLGIDDSMINLYDPETESTFKKGAINLIDANDLPKPVRGSSSGEYVPKEGRVTKDSLRADIVFCREDGEPSSNSGAEDVVIESDDPSTIVYGCMRRGSFEFMDYTLLDNEEFQKYGNLSAESSCINAIINSGIGVPDDIMVIGIKGQLDNASFRKAKKFNWIPAEDFIKEWISNNKETIELISEFKTIHKGKNYIPEIEKLHPIIAEYNAKRQELVEEITKETEGLWTSYLPYYKDNSFSTPRIDELVQLKKKLDDAEVYKWEEIYSNIRWERHREFIWDAICLKASLEYDENLQPVDLTKNLEVKAATDEEENEEDTEVVENEEDTVAV